MLGRIVHYGPIQPRKERRIPPKVFLLPMIEGMIAMTVEETIEIIVTLAVILATETIEILEMIGAQETTETLAITEIPATIEILLLKLNKLVPERQFATIVKGASECR